MHDFSGNEEHTRAGALGRFLGYIKERRETVGNSLHLKANTINARPLVQPADEVWSPNYNSEQGGNGPQQAPDPIRQGMFDGYGHIGKARIPKFVSSYDQTAWENQNFVSDKLRMMQSTNIPFGHMSPEYERANIEIPDVSSFGSQFVSYSEPYGYI